MSSGPATIQLAEFEEAVAEASRQAKEAGMMPIDISTAIAEVRKERRLRRSRR